MAHAILVMSDNNAFSQGYSYKDRVTVHWILQAISLILITVGQTAIYIVKENYGSDHYTTTHSWFGLSSYLLTLGATLGGVLTKYSFQLRSYVKPAMLKIGHGFAGSVVFALAAATIFLGLNQSWTDFGDMQIKFGILFALVISTIYVISKSVKGVLTRVANKSE